MVRTAYLVSGAKPFLILGGQDATSMAYSNIFVPLLLSLGDAGSVQGMIKSDKGFRAGVYMYYGKTVNSYVSNHFNLSSNNLDLYLSAF